MATLPSPVGIGRGPRASGGVASFSLGRNDAPQMLAQAGAEIDRATQIIQESNRKQDEIAAMDAVNKLKQQSLLLERDPENGFLAARGNKVASPEFSKGYQERLTRAADQISGGLSSDYAKQVFKRHQEVVSLQYQSTLLQHQAKETLAFNQQTRSNTIAIGMDDIAAHPYDDSSFQTNMLQIGKAVVDSGKEIGLDGEALANYTKDKLGDIQSKALHSRISAMLAANDGVTAQKYFEEHKTEMRLDAVQSVQSALKEVGARTAGQTFADEVEAQGLGLKESLDKAREKFSASDPVTREAAINAVKTRFAEKEAVKATDQKDATDTAWKVITNGGSRNGIPPELWNRLGGEEQRQINDYERAKIERAKNDAQNKPTDMEKYYGARSKAANDPAAFAKMDLIRLGPYMKDSELKHLMEIQASINKGDIKAMESQATVKRTVGILKAEIAKAGIDLSPKNPAKATETAAFFGAVTDALDQATAAKGAPLTDDEARRIGMSKLRDGYEQGSGIFGAFQTKKKGYQEEPGKTYITKPFSDIPEDIRNTLATAYRKKHGLGTRPLTGEDEAEIERAYTRGVDLGRIK